MLGPSTIFFSKSQETILKHSKPQHKRVLSELSKNRYRKEGISPVTKRIDLSGSDEDHSTPFWSFPSVIVTY